ncbi:MAG TPA: glycoside hydrolase family 3 C-terminal domain-containing protein [Glycomyces sp.]
MTPDERADSLLARLTLDEKLSLLHQYAPAIPRLGIAPYRTGQEVLHSASWLPYVTEFPQAVGLGATWNPDLLRRIGTAVEAELDEKRRDDPAIGTNVWGPVVNLLRDPRWGRNQEGYSEDPVLTAVLAVGFCTGLRGDGPRPRTAPTLKHFLGYNNETGKEDTRAAPGMGPRALREYDMRPFTAVLDAGAADGVMLSYSSVNGRPCHVSPYVADLRERHPDLVVVADAHGTLGLVDYLGYYDDHAEAFAAAMHAGLDSFTNNGPDPEPTLNELRTALTAGRLTEERVDASVRRLLLMRARLGEFEAPAGREPAPAPLPDSASLPDSADHRALAREAARQSVVLLKNDGILPLDTDAPGSVALIGPHAGLNLLDWLAGTPPYRVTPLEALASRLGPRLRYVEAVDRIALRCEEGYVGADSDGALALGEDVGGFDVLDWGGGVVALRAVANGRFVTRTDAGVLAAHSEIPGGWTVPEEFRPIVADDGTWIFFHPASETFVSIKDGKPVAVASESEAAARFRPELLASAAEAAAAAASGADTVVVMVGTHPLINGRERFDQTDIGLPSAQEAVARAAVEANPRTAVVLVGGGPIAVPWLADRAPALAWSCHGGQEFGNAIADVLLGDCAPSGRLPQTWYRSEADLGSILDYDIIKTGKTYQYFTGEPLYPFGHGLSYTSFAYGPIELSDQALTDEDELTVSIAVANTGDRDGAEVVQCYVRPPGDAVKQPRLRLCAFERAHLPAGASRILEFRLPVADFAYWDVSRGVWTVEPGSYQILIGRSAGDIVLSADLTVAAEPVPPRDMRTSLVRAVDCDDYHATAIVDTAKGTREAIEARARGAWLLIRNADLGSGVDLAVAQATGGARIEVRLDDPVEGELAGALDVPASDGDWPWRTVEAPVSGKGVRDVYLVFDTPGGLAAFGFS